MVASSGRCGPRAGCGAGLLGPGRRRTRLRDRHRTRLPRAMYARRSFTADWSHRRYVTGRPKFQTLFQQMPQYGKHPAMTFLILGSSEISRRICRSRAPRRPSFPLGRFPDPGNPNSTTIRDRGHSGPGHGLRFGLLDNVPVCLEAAAPRSCVAADNVGRLELGEPLEHARFVRQASPPSTRRPPCAPPASLVSIASRENTRRCRSRFRVPPASAQSLRRAA